MKSRIRRVAFVCVCVLILNASWCYPKVAGANELDSPGLLHLGRDAVIAVNAKETLLAAWSPDHSEEIQLCEIHTGTRRMGLSVLGDTELVHLEFMEPRGYLRGVTRTGTVLVWRGRESAEAVELEGSQPLVGHFAIDSGGAYLLHAGDSGEEGVAGSVWNLASGERMLTFPGSSGLGGTFSPDGIRAVLVTPESALVGDLETKETKTVVEFTETVDLCMVSPTKRCVACQARNRGTLVDTATADVIYVDGSLGIWVYFTPSDEKLMVAHGKELAFVPKAGFAARIDSRGKKLFCLGHNQDGVVNLRTRAYIPMENFGRTSPGGVDRLAYPCTDWSRCSTKVSPERKCTSIG